MSAGRREDRFEFVGMVGREGSLRIPRALRAELAGRKIRVRLTPQTVAAKLTAAGVTEEEMERIGALQREAREQVVRFMLSEGALAERAPLRTRKGRR